MLLHLGPACGGTARICRAVLAVFVFGVGVFGLDLTAYAIPPDGTEPQLSVPTPMPASPSIPKTPVVAGAITPGSVPAPAVRVYVLNGTDAFGFAGLRPMANRLRASGYPDTRFGGWYQSRKFEREIRRLNSQQPGTPVAIIGYSFGAYRAKAMANRLTRDGVPVVMVGYIGGDYLRNTPSAIPGGVRVVNVTGNGFLPTGRNLFFNGTDISGATNLRLPGVRHFDLPKRAETLDALLAGIAPASPPTVTPEQPAVSSSSAYGPSATPVQPSPRSFRLVRRVDPWTVAR